MTEPLLPPIEPPSSRKLLRSTLLALAVATLLLVTVVLPAEYGIDPTGTGSILGLTRMGEIKTRLAKEAAADAAADRAADAAEDSAATADSARVRAATPHDTLTPPQR